ncbi:2-succinyl-6-hydroxy-2,4-cyclohexadiene-1-carboxylate synthase [Bacillus sp. PS06]|uniref:2-succinyl-6-hydroxy-2, 4-cyclohexadiene-1-carboxylate synthase n=1 Tax=Bacillus sp. PS06 TaxID=2764176 RepID=UPI00177FDD3D|nr:2-succinyl-6-hydroxy-2,4-cyclohexadiene-1-carboxylate synthase [Bacillus sp. PS06]MBD8068550.1 2-succinyl-6-hydroxy-2,4-cyclohexadiene-1-carboxylate synthase [Bacillus sp. PS06]
MFISVHGVKYHVEIIGEGDPIVFLHGFTGSIGNWHEVIPYVQENHQLVLIDHIGHGKSDHPDEIEYYHFNRVKDDFIQILDQLKIDSTSLVGYSMGGRLALALAVDYPKRFHKLVLESSSPGIETQSGRDERVKADLALASFIEKEGLEAFVNHWEGIPLFSTQREMDQRKQEYLHEQRMENNELGLANSLRGMGTGAQPSYWNRLNEVKIPTLLVCGEQDQKFCMIAEKMATLLTNARIEKFNGAGHAIHMEQPENFGKIVSVFLSS